MDFLQDALSNGTHNSIEDAFTREMLHPSDEDLSQGTPGWPEKGILHWAALCVICRLERLRVKRELPEQIIVDNGIEFTSKALDQWVYENHVQLQFITPGRPMENGYIESFHGKFREECLNKHWFLILDDTRETI